MRRQLAPDTEIARLATAQHGIVARGQLIALGLSAQFVDRAVRRGRLQLIHRGVYAVGHRALTVEGHWMAAALATGGALSHTTAAAAWDLRRSSGAIHVTVPHTGRVRRAGIRLHRSATLEGDITMYRAIPVTTPARTIVDLATTLRGRPLEHVLDLADQRGLIDFADLHSRRIPRSLQAVLSLYDAGTTPTRSELEERFLRLCDDHGIQRPETNARIEGYEVDFVWRSRRLIVEVDGYAYHRSPTAFETDRERDVLLTTAGWRVLRFTWRQIALRPSWVAAALDM